MGALMRLLGAYEPICTPRPPPATPLPIFPLTSNLQRSVLYLCPHLEYAVVVWELDPLKSLLLHAL